MTISLGKAILEIATDMSGFALDDAKKSMLSFGAISKQSMTALGAAAGIAASAVSATAAAVVALGMRGAVVGDVQREFGLLSEKMGETADTMAGALRRGTVGAIKDFELMQLANKAMGAGFKGSALDMEDLASGSRLLAKRVGGDTTQAFDQLTTAMATGRTQSLAQLGLFVDQKLALQEYAASLGKSTGELTTAERQTALQTAAMKALRDVIADAGPQAADFGERVDGLKARFANFTDALAVAINDSPVVAAGMEAIGAAMDQAFGGNQEALVKSLTGWVNEFAIGIASGAQIAVTAARAIVDGWNFLKIAFAAIMVGIVGGLELITKANLFVVEQAAKLPIVGDHYRGVADGIRESATQLEGMRKSFQAQTGEAIDKAGEQRAAFDRLQGGIGAVKQAMIAASQQQAAAVPTAAALASANNGLSAALAGAADKTKQQMAAEKELNAIRAKNIADDMKEASKLATHLAKVSDERALAEMKAIEDRYNRDLQANAQIQAAFRTLHEDMALTQTDGVQKRLLELEFARDKEIAGLQHLKATHAAEYEELVALVKDKYQQMADAATGSGQTIEQRARALGYTSRAELQETADKAKVAYDEMLASGLFTTGELERAHKDAEAKKRLASNETKNSALNIADQTAEGTLQIFGALGQKFKAAAIAGAIISTYMAVAKALAAGVWPFNLVQAAGALAAGMANVMKIRSSDAGFKTGTPRLDFQSFGRERSVTVHGEEAIIPRGGGHQLAGEIAAAMGGAGAGGGDRTINVIFDGQSVARAVVPHIPGEVNVWVGH